MGAISYIDISYIDKSYLNLSFKAVFSLFCQNCHKYVIYDFQCFLCYLIYGVPLLQFTIIPIRFL